LNSPKKKVKPVSEGLLNLGAVSLIYFNKV